MNNRCDTARRPKGLLPLIMRPRSLLFSVLLLHALVLARQALAIEAEVTQSTLDIAAQDPFPVTQVLIFILLTFPRVEKQL